MQESEARLTIAKQGECPTNGRSLDFNVVLFLFMRGSMDFLVYVSFRYSFLSSHVALCGVRIMFKGYSMFFVSLSENSLNVQNPPHYWSLVQKIGVSGKGQYRGLRMAVSPFEAPSDGGDAQRERQRERP